MQKVDITLFQAFKVLFGLIWRSMVLNVPIIFISFGLLSYLGIFPTGQATPEEVRSSLAMSHTTFAAVWILSMILGVLAHCQALRWLLKTNWSDFKLVAVKNSHEAETKNEV